MRRYRLSYFLGQSFKSLWRNGLMTIASITVLLSCLVVMGSFSLLIMNINTNLENLGLLNEIVVFIDFDKDKSAAAEKAGMNIAADTSADTPLEPTEEETLTEAETEAAEPVEDEYVSAKPATREEEMVRLAEIEAQIRALRNVSEVTLVTKEQALADEREKYKEYDGLYDLVEDDNPLRDSFVIKYKDNSKVSTLVFDLGTIDGIDKINNRQDLAQSIESVKSSVSLVLVWFMSILFAVSVFVIINTINLALHSRHAEITIMRYIGATDWFIMVPFLIEGIVMGIVSSAAAFFIQWYIYGYVIKLAEDSFLFVKILDFSEVAQTVGVAFLGIGVITGIIGSIISTRKYLKA